MLNYETGTIDYLETDVCYEDDEEIEECLIANHIDPETVAYMSTESKPLVYNINLQEHEEVFV
nr:MAG TPA: hypothetical protein [Crassvirales sp.]